MDLSPLERPGFPEAIGLEVGSSRVIDVGDGVNAVLVPPDLASATVEMGYLKLTANRVGHGVVFLVDRISSRSITITVVPPAVVVEERAAQKARKDTDPRAVDDALRIRTGGLIDRASITAGDRWLGRDHFSSTALSWRGRLSGHEFAISLGQSARVTPDLVMTPIGGTGAITVKGEHVNVSYATGTGEQTFTIRGGAAPYRLLGAGLKFGFFDSNFELRGPYDPRLAIFFPTAGNARLGVDFGDAFRFSVGTFVGFGPGTPLVPYALAGTGFGGWRLQAAVGTNALTSTGDVRLAIGARVESPNGPCQASLAYYDGAGLGAGLGGFITNTSLSLQAAGHCSIGPVSVNLIAMRSDFTSLSGAFGQLVPSISLALGGTRVWAQGYVAPSADLETLRGNGQLGIMQVLGPVSATATATVQQFGSSRIYGGGGVLALGLGPFSLSARANALVDPDFALQSVIYGGNLAIRTAPFDLSVNAFRLQRPGSASVTNVLGSMSFKPAPAWTFSLLGMVFPEQAGNFQVGGSVTWTFGDSLEREPALGWLRSHTVKARTFNDLNANGVWDFEEKALPGISVCALDKCVVSDATGVAELRELPERFVTFNVDIGSMPGLQSTTTSSTRLPIGGYSTPTVTFGLRQVAQMLVKAIVDVDDDGRADFGEPVMKGLRATVTHDGVDHPLDLTDGVALDEFPFLGEWKVALDPSSIPPNYLIGSFASRSVDVKEFAKGEIILGLMPLRSVAGEVCIDDDGDAKCGPKDQKVDGVPVSCGERVGVTDANGRFLLPRVLSTLCELTVGEAELPAGVVQRAPVRFNVGSVPAEHKGIPVTVVRDPTAKRQLGVRFIWPKVGHAVVVELGGYTLDATAFRVKGKVAEAAKLATWKPANADKTSLERALKLLKEKQTMLFVQVTTDTTLPDDKAKADAEAMLEAFKRFLVSGMRVPADKLVTEIVPGVGKQPAISTRVYQFFRRLKPDEIKEMEDQKAAEKKKAEEAQQPAATQGTGQQPAPTGVDVPMRRLDVRVRVRVR